MNDQVITGKHVVDALSGVAIVTTLMGWLPPVAALLGIVWYTMQIYDWIEGRVKGKPAPKDIFE